MSTRNLPADKGRPARNADNLTDIRQPMSRKCGSLDVSQPHGPPWRVTGIAFFSNLRNFKLFLDAKLPLVYAFAMLFLPSLGN
jgi:hypothetical protein